MYFYFIDLFFYRKFTEIKCSPVRKSLYKKELLIILRGETFRDNNRLDESSKITKLSSQEECIDKFIKHVILVLRKTLPNTSLFVKIIAYPHPNNYKLVKAISEHVKCEIEEISKEKNNQITTFLHCIKRAIEFNCAAILMIRIDIAFISDICTDNFCQNKVLFQWNLLHNKRTLEVPDQIHFIGSDNFMKLYKGAFFNNKKLSILDNDQNELKSVPISKLDFRWPGTLHNFLLFCLKILKPNQIGYLNYIKDPDINKIDCDVRGHPNSRLGNPLYKF